MEREINIHPESLSKEDREGAINHLLNRRNEAESKQAGELEKTPEELQVIEKINEYYRHELEDLNLEFNAINPGRFHVYTTDAFHKKFPKVGNRVAAFHSDLSGAIYLNKSKTFGRLGLYKTMFHEAGHEFSYHKYNVDVNDRKIAEDRSGYSVRNLKEINHEHLRGLNEAILDKIVQDILNKNMEDFSKTINIQELEDPRAHYYDAFIEVVETVINKIAQDKKENPDEVWQRFKKGFFDGSMMHLRDIEKVYGKGALRIFAFLGEFKEGPDISEEEEEKETEKVLAYFQTEQPKERERLVSEILNEREKFRYINRRR